MIKERADPQNPKNFHPICKICEFKYIEKRISDENKNKDNIHKVEKEVLTKKLAEIEAELKKKKNDYKEKKQEVTLTIINFS